MESSNNDSRESRLSTFGTFEGFNFRSQSAIEKRLTAQDVIQWNHDRDGEAEFWPSGDSNGVRLLWNGANITASDILTLVALLETMGGDDDESFLQIYSAINVLGNTLTDLSAEKVESLSIMVFRGTNFYDVRKEAAFHLFEMFYPELFKIWDETPCDGLRFDTDDFLDSPSWWTDEVQFGEEAVLLVVGI